MWGFQGVVPYCMRWHQTQRWSLLGSTHPQWSGERRGGRHPPWQEAHHWWSWSLAVPQEDTRKVSGDWNPQNNWSAVNGTNSLVQICCAFKGELTMPQSGSAFSTPMYSKKLAKPSFSQRSSHQSIVTMFPNHWKNTNPNKGNYIQNLQGPINLQGIPGVKISYGLPSMKLKTYCTYVLH